MSEAEKFWEPAVGDRVRMSLPVGLAMQRQAIGSVIRVTPTQVVALEDGRDARFARRFRKDPHSSRLAEVKAGRLRAWIRPA